MGSGRIGMRAILFTDVVGSTQLRLTLGEDLADSLRRAHDQLLGEIVDTHHGNVLRWMGDGLKAEFPAASTALQAALAMQRAVATYGRRADAIAAFQIRIGLSVGEITVEDGDDHGVAVIEAARLEALAAPGEILATALVEALGRRRIDAGFEPLGELHLKGLEDPVAVVRVIDTAPDADRPPLPRQIVVDRRFPMVGRARETTHVSEQWRAVTAGSTRTVFVTGQPGIGKSRVTAHTADLAHSDGAHVLAGVCDSELMVPYQPLATAFRAVGELDEQLRAAIADGSGPLGALFPGHQSGRSDEQGPVARFELFEAVAELVTRLSEQRPIVLVLEDLQWATPPTLLMLRHLVQHVTEQRVLLVGTYRSEEIGATHPLRDLLAEIHALDRVSRLELAALEEHDVAEMVTARVPAAPPDNALAFARRVRDESAGSPFFVCELLHHLATTEQLDRLVIEGAGAQLPIPESVRDVVGQRLGRLPESAGDVLAGAALIGLSFDLVLLAAVLERPIDGVLDVVELAERGALVQELDAGRYTFSHAIVRTTLLDRMSATRLAIGHRRVAEAIEQTAPGNYDALAHHWLQAGVPDKAYANIERAAERDLRALAYESAAERFQQTLDHLRRDPDADQTARARASLGLGLARRALGDPGYLAAVQEAGRVARRLRDADLMADAAVASIWPGTMFVTAGRIEDGLVELCEDALALLDPADQRRVQIMSTLASHLTFDADRARVLTLLRDAQALARQIGDPVSIGGALVSEYLATWNPSTFERRHEIAREVARMARASGDPQLEFFGLFFTAVGATERCDLETARRALADMRGAIEITRQFYFAFLADRLTVSLDLFVSRPDMQPAIDALAETYGSTHADTAGTWAAQSGGLAIQAGTIGQLAPVMTSMFRDSHLSSNWISGYGVALFASGDREGAQRVMDGFAEPLHDYFWLTTIQIFAELAADLEDIPACSRLLTLLEPFRGQLGMIASGSLIFGLVSRSLGRLALTVGRLDLAADLLTEAVTVADAAGVPFEATVSRRLLAATLIASGAPAADATPHLERARATATEFGFDGELRQLDQLSARLGTFS